MRVGIRENFVRVPCPVNVRSTDWFNQERPIAEIGPPPRVLSWCLGGAHTHPSRRVSQQEGHRGNAPVGGWVSNESPDRFARDLTLQLTGHDFLKSLGIVLLTALLVHALHAALEDRVVALDRSAGC